MASTPGRVWPLVTVIGLVAAGCGPAATDGTVTTAVVTPGPSVIPAAMVASKDGVRLEVSLASASVLRGQPIKFHIRVVNGRASAVNYKPSLCNLPATVSALLDLPFDEPGRNWDGIAAAFKTFALTRGDWPGRADDSTQLRIEPRFCHGGSDEETLAPGTSIESDIEIPAEIVTGVPALAGVASISAVLIHDIKFDPPNPDPGSSGLPAHCFGCWTSEVLAVDGHVALIGEAPQPISGGQALDALLANPTFETWLAEQSEEAWSGSNLFIWPGGGGGIMPDRPSWQIELFREPRNWAIAFVDVYSGAILSATYCNVPCDR